MGCFCDYEQPEFYKTTERTARIGHGGFMRALINLNDETGKDLFSVECDDDVGNWLASFETLEEAEYFINARRMLHIHATDFRDTRQDDAK